MNKFLILIQSMKIIKNWHILLLVYFHIYRKNYYILKLRDVFKIKLRNKSTDIKTFANIARSKRFVTLKILRNYKGVCNED